ncbi:MAG TPA: xanthine dehydrogenase family protein subunit M [Conexivisphaerales archaeon]|nr:xanthine dehydrogenase family protein subunit M [Conexivisphaerales archaeon]
MSFGSPYFTVPKFEYVKPKTLDEALQFLAEKGEDTKVLAGGVGLLAFMKERLIDCKYVLDIKGIPELHQLGFRKGMGLGIGAAVTLSELLELPVLKEKYTALYDAVRNLSDPNIRNRATLLGDLCEAIPWIDSPPPLILFDAEVVIGSVRGVRNVKVKDFIVGTAETALQHDELAEYIHVPEPAPGTVSRYLKFSKGTEFSIASVGALVANRDDPAKRSVRLAYGAINVMPIEAFDAEKVFTQDKPVKELIAEALKVVDSTVETLTDVLGTAEYRKHLVKVQTAAVLKEIMEA